LRHSSTILLTIELTTPYQQSSVQILVQYSLKYVPQFTFKTLTIADFRFLITKNVEKRCRTHRSDAHVTDQSSSRRQTPLPAPRRHNNPQGQRAAAAWFLAFIKSCHRGHPCTQWHYRIISERRRRRRTAQCH
jgi:hypothetical protein